MSIHPDLEWLARNVSEWGSALNFSHIGIFWDGGDPKADYVPGMAVDPDGRFRQKGHRVTSVFSHQEWRQARHALGLESPEVTEAEDEAWQAMDEKQSRQKYSAYFKDVRHLDYIDVYRTVSLFDCEKHGHAISHAAKKLLLTGVRTGGKSVEQEVKEAIDTLNRWLEMREEDASALRAGELGG